MEQLLLAGGEALTQDFETDLNNLTQKLVEPLDRNKTELGDNNYSNASEIIDYIKQRISNKGESGAGTSTAGTAKGTANANAKSAANGTAKSTANGTAKGAANGTAKSIANSTAKDAANGTAESLTNVTKLLRILKEVNRIEAPKNRSAENRSEENGNKENGNEENGSEENASEENKTELITYIEELNATIEKLTLGAMFFASLSDVHKNGFDTKDDDPDSNKNEEAIAEILSSYALPVVSFRQKAEPRSHIFLSAYATHSISVKIENSAKIETMHFDIDASISSTYLDDKDNTSADSVRERPNSFLYVPIGIEIGIGSSRIPLIRCIPGIRSFDFLVAPFDFAYPWQQQSSSSEESFSLDDIWAPSIVGSVSFKTVPIVAGIGYQETRYDEIRNAFNDRRFWFVGIDMPLYSFY